MPKTSNMTPLSKVHALPGAGRFAFQPSRDGDACSAERAADALNCARINPKPLGNFAHPWSSGFAQSLTDGLFQLGGNRRPAKPFALATSPPKARTDSFLNHRPFKLGKNAHHLEHGLPGWCRGIEALLMQKQVNAQRV
jgi:hypothetical protein